MEITPWMKRFLEDEKEDRNLRKSIAALVLTIVATVTAFLGFTDFFTTSQMQILSAYPSFVCHNKLLTSQGQWANDASSACCDGGCGGIGGGGGGGSNGGGNEWSWYCYPIS